MNLTVPAHAFDYLDIKEKNATATDLLTGKKAKLPLKRDAAFDVSLPARGGVVYKLKL